MFCTNCGKEIPDDSVFCDFCGSRVQTEEEREKTVLVREEPGSGEGEAGQMKEVYCTNCGKPVSEGDRFCIYCGEVIGEDVTPEEIKVMKKGRGKVHLPHINKKIAVAAAAVVVVAGAGLGLGVLGIFNSPKAKVLLGAKKTWESAVSGDTTLNHMLGLDEMADEVANGRTFQRVEFSQPQSGFELTAELSSDQKKKTASGTVEPEWNGISPVEIAGYRNGNVLYGEIPGVTDLYYVDLDKVREDLKHSAIRQWILNEYNMDLADLVPGGEGEKTGYLEACQDELKNLFEATTVEKDGKEKLNIGGKSQNCDRYKVTIPERELLDLWEATVDYVDDSYSWMMLQALIRELTDIRMDDVEMTVCLDKKGRLVKVVGEKMDFIPIGDDWTLEWEILMTGKDSPADSIEAEVEIWDGTMGPVSFIVERDKQYDKKSGIQDLFRVEVDDSGDRESLDYEFSYNPQKEDWELHLTDNRGNEIAAEGKLTDLKKGKSMTLTVDYLGDDHESYMEGQYSLSALKDDIKLEHLEDAEPILDLSLEELRHMIQDAAMKQLVDVVRDVIIYSIW